MGHGEKGVSWGQGLVVKYKRWAAENSGYYICIKASKKYISKYLLVTDPLRKEETKKRPVSAPTDFWQTVIWFNPDVRPVKQGLLLPL